MTLNLKSRTFNHMWIPFFHKWCWIVTREKTWSHLYRDLPMLGNNVIKKTCLSELNLNSSEIYDTISLRWKLNPVWFPEMSDWNGCMEVVLFSSCFSWGTLSAKTITSWKCKSSRRNGRRKGKRGENCVNEDDTKHQMWTDINPSVNNLIQK